MIIPKRLCGNETRIDEYIRDKMIGLMNKVGHYPSDSILLESVNKQINKYLESRFNLNPDHTTNLGRLYNMLGLLSDYRKCIKREYELDHADLSKPAIPDNREPMTIDIKYSEGYFWITLPRHYDVASLLINSKNVESCTPETPFAIISEEEFRPELLLGCCRNEGNVYYATFAEIISIHTERHDDFLNALTIW